RPGVELIGEGTLTERMWTRPAISVLGNDAPRTPEASNQLVPMARAKVSMRIPPGQDPDEAMEGLVKHLESNVPWGAEVKIVREGSGAPYSLRAEGPVNEAMKRAMREAYGKAPVQMGAGGSIPFVAEFALHDVDKVGRARGSPVLELRVAAPGVPPVVLFYFVKPPDIYSSGMPNPRFAGASFLMQSNALLAEEVAGWEREIQAAHRAR